MKTKELHEKEYEEGEKVYELVPPDGGWGYAVTFANSLIMVSLNV